MRPAKTHCPSRKYSPWKVYFRGKVYWLKDEQAADGKIAELERGVPRGSLSGRDVDDYLRAKELLKGTPILAAARYYVDHHPTEGRAVLVEDAAKAFHLDCDASGCRPKTTTMRVSFLRPLLRACGQKWVSDVTRPDVEDVLKVVLGKRKDPAVHARNNTLRIIRQFFNWAKDKGLVLDNVTDAHAGRRKIEYIKTRAARGFLSIDDVRLLLTTCFKVTPDILPAVALQAFAGIRTAEVQRMTWGDIVERRGLIHVRGEAAKVDGAERVIDWWPDALNVWLVRPQGVKDATPIVRGYDKKKGALLRACSTIAWSQNALRHSYATYGCAFHQSADRMKLLMGQQSESVFFSNYRRWVEQGDGVTYFSGIVSPYPRGVDT